jgi:hypothetical protein
MVESECPVNQQLVMAAKSQLPLPTRGKLPIVRLFCSKQHFALVIYQITSCVVMQMVG